MCHANGKLDTAACDSVYFEVIPNFFNEGISTAFSLFYREPGELKTGRAALPENGPGETGFEPRAFRVWVRGQRVPAL
jgi:hypothetical protein